MENTEKDWKAGLLEEECYKRFIKDMLSRRKTNEPHPFYRIIEGSASFDSPGKCPVPEAEGDAVQNR
jgi:hypothetical protein